MICFNLWLARFWRPKPRNFTLLGIDLRSFYTEKIKLIVSLKSWIAKQFELKPHNEFIFVWHPIETPTDYFFKKGGLLLIFHLGMRSSQPQFWRLWFTLKYSQGRDHVTLYGWDTLSCGSRVLLLSAAPLSFLCEVKPFRRIWWYDRRGAKRPRQYRMRSTTGNIWQQRFLRSACAQVGWPRGQRFDSPRAIFFFLIKKKERKKNKVVLEKES